MLNRFASLAAAGLLVTLGAAPLAAAEPDAAPIPENAVPSAEPGVLATPDGYHLTVSARDETQQVIPPLTTALSSREYLVGATFNGSVKGTGGDKRIGGTLEVGYQIGCGIGLDSLNIIGGVGIRASILRTGGLSPNFSAPIFGRVETDLTAGEVKQVAIDTKKFKGSDPRVSLTDLHIKIDGCVGQSYLRSYAVLTSSTESSDDVVTYLGVTKVV